MSLPIVSVFYALVSMATLWLVLLWMVARLGLTRFALLIKVVCGLATPLLLFLPVGGLPLWSSAFSFFPNPSLPALGVVSAALCRSLCGVTILKPADWRATWMFGAITGSVLYLHPIFFRSLDLYYWGWDRAGAAWALAALAGIFLAGGNRLGVLLLGALIAYSVDALESANCWDYLIDPLYWLISLGVTVSWGINRLIVRRGSARVYVSAPG
jgi:hypothetical protein